MQPSKQQQATPSRERAVQRVSKPETQGAWQKSSEFIERYGAGQTSKRAAVGQNSPAPTLTAVLVAAAANWQELGSAR